MDRVVFSDGTMSISGPYFKIRVPGYGVIFAESGHQVMDLATGQVISNSGPNQFIDGDAAALCQYLK